MKAVMAAIIVALAVVLSNTSVSAQTLEQTPTGFYYPTGTSIFGNYADWLEEPPPNGNYYPDYYHIGWDIAANLSDPVYAIAEGEVVHVSPNDWGDGNEGLLIRHVLQDGTEFVAVYGHVRSDLVAGNEVAAGQQIATIGPWPDGNHLHFGVHPGGSLPPDPYGMLHLPVTPPYNGWVDPIAWIVQHTPGEFYKAIYADKTPHYPGGLDYYPVAPEQILPVSFTFNNEGGTYWTKNEASSHYIELHSVTDQYNADHPSELAHDWIADSDVRIVTTTGQVAAGGQGLYSFINTSFHAILNI